MIPKGSIVGDLRLPPDPKLGGAKRYYGDIPPDVLFLLRILGSSWGALENYLRQGVSREGAPAPAMTEFLAWYEALGLFLQRYRDAPIPEVFGGEHGK